VGGVLGGCPRGRKKRCSPRWLTKLGAQERSFYTRACELLSDFGVKRSISLGGDGHALERTTWIRRELCKEVERVQRHRVLFAEHVVESRPGAHHQRFAARRIAGEHREADLDVVELQIDRRVGADRTLGLLVVLPSLISLPERHVCSANVV